jgi:pimeloyl-ACP methyl ester carboxylesterase
MHRSAVSLIADRHPTFRRQFLALSIPRTFIFGEENLPNPEVERLSSEGIHVCVVEKAGHDMMSDNPNGFAQAIVAALL